MLGLKQEELAKLADISLQYLSYIETNKRKPSLDVLERIAAALKVPVGLLLIKNLEEEPDMDNPTMSTLNRLLIDLLFKLRKSGNEGTIPTDAKTNSKRGKKIPVATTSNDVKAKSKHPKGVTMEMSDQKK
jgi:transcriptional regulator with XRE-family HTH domain